MSTVARIKSLHPYTEFGPNWNIPIYHNVFQEYDVIDTIRNWLIENEQKFLDLPVHNDGGTGLGDESVTSRFSTYNLFDYIEECPSLQHLLDFFRFSYVDFIDKENGMIRELDFLCWFNIIRPGEEIKIHKHGSGPDVYISGNLHLDDYDTKTFYLSPYDEQNAHVSHNLKGGLTLFPTYLEHGATKYEGEGLRVSIAFDLRLPFQTNPYNDADSAAMNCRPFITNEAIQENYSQDIND